MWQRDYKLQLGIWEKLLSLSAAAGRAGRGSTKMKRDHNQINGTVQKRSLE